MRFAIARQAVCACVLAGCVAVAGASASEPRGAVGYLQNASEEDAADYLAFVIRAYGCEVRREDRPEFNDVILDFLSFEFGEELGPTDESGARLVSDAVRRGLFAFSYRAGPRLVERGELVIDNDGTARLLTCNSLLS